MLTHVVCRKHGGEGGRGEEREEGADLLALSVLISDPNHVPTLMLVCKSSELQDVTEYMNPLCMCMCMCMCVCVCVRVRACVCKGGLSHHPMLKEGLGKGRGTASHPESRVHAQVPLVMSL